MPASDDDICWIVAAPLSVRELRAIAAREWKKRFPHAIDPSPFEAIAGTKAYAALVSREPGSEGIDRDFAEAAVRASKNEPVYSLWFHPDRATVLEWRGRAGATESDRDPAVVVSELGLALVVGPAVTQAPPANGVRTCAVIEGPSLDEVRAALGTTADEPWLRIAQTPVGILLSAVDGETVGQAWDVADAIPSATLYAVRRDATSFSVLVIRASDVTRTFHLPPVFGAKEQLDAIRGATTPETIADALAIPRALLGLAP